jgi:glycosyltransferase involved in cell wall biosynthesis
MLFSVIIPNLHSPIVHLTIESVRKQDLDISKFEVIVVGLDKHNAVQAGGNVRFVETPGPVPPAVARNWGAARAVGDILVFLDADCLCPPQWLSLFAEHFQNPEVNIAGGGVAFETSNYWSMSDNIGMFHDYLTSAAVGHRGQLPSLNLAIRRWLFMEIGGFDERYPRPAGEDSDLSLRLRRRGYPLWFFPQPAVLHRPPRTTLKDLMRHNYFQGKYSTKVDPRYGAEEGLPLPLRTRWGVLLAAPILAVLVTLKIFVSNQKLLRYLHSFPAIFLGKICWCLGASNHAWRCRQSRENPIGVE